MPERSGGRRRYNGSAGQAGAAIERRAKLVSKLGSSATFIFSRHDTIRPDLHNPT